MSTGISVVRLGDVLLVAVPADPDDRTVSGMQTQLLTVMERSGVEGLILDLSTVETVDSFFARTITDTVRMVELMGGIAVLCGMQAGVAVTAVQMGLHMGDIPTGLNVDRAMLRLQELLAQRRST